VLQSYILDSILSVVCVHIFCFSSSKEKMCSRKKQLVQDRMHIHTHVYFVHINECMYEEI